MWSVVSIFWKMFRILCSFAYVWAQQDYSDYSYSKTPSPRPKRRWGLDGFEFGTGMTCMTTWCAIPTSLWVLRSSIVCSILPNAVSFSATCNLCHLIWTSFRLYSCSIKDQSVNLILFHSFSTNFRTFENSVVFRIATDLGFGQLRQAQEKAPPTSTQSEFFKAKKNEPFFDVFTMLRDDLYIILCNFMSALECHSFAKPHACAIMHLLFAYIPLVSWSLGLADYVFAKSLQVFAPFICLSCWGPLETLCYGEVRQLHTISGKPTATRSQKAQTPRGDRRQLYATALSMFIDVHSAYYAYDLNMSQYLNQVSMILLVSLFMFCSI